MARRSRSRRNLHFGERDLAVVERCLREDLSPEQTAGKLKGEGTLSISHETIYKYIWRDKAEGGVFYRHLRGHQKRRRKRYRSYDSRGRLVGKRAIETRPHSGLRASVCIVGDVIMWLILALVYLTIQLPLYRIQARLS